jgi:hypothetical protein
MTVTSEEFKAFVARHSSLNRIIAAESNDEMRNSYLILDEYMRFVDVSLCEISEIIQQQKILCLCICICVCAQILGQLERFQDTIRVHFRRWCKVGDEQKWF